MVKCEPDQILPILFIRHGPVVYQDHDRSLAVAISTVFTCPGTAPYMGSIKSMRATSLHEFPKALVGWGAPSVNMLYADVAGDIC
jgi:penicillin amidase